MARCRRDTKSPLKGLMRPPGHLPLVLLVLLSKGGCSPSLKGCLIQLPHQSTQGFSGDWGRDDGLKLGTRNLAPQPLLTLSLDRPHPFMLLWGKEMEKIIPEVPSRLFHDSCPYVPLAFEVFPGTTFPKLLPSFCWAVGDLCGPITIVGVLLQSAQRTK